MRKPNVTIIIQGPLNMKSISAIPEYLETANVVVSHYLAPNSGDTKYHTSEDVGKRLELQKIMVEQQGCSEVTLTFPPEPNPDYRMHQLLTTYKGMCNVNTEYVMKLRSDEYYTPIIKFIDEYLKNPATLLCSNIFWKPESAYHISDHIMMAKTKVFSSGLEAYLKREANLKRNFQPKKLTDAITRMSCESSFARSFILGKYKKYKGNFEKIDKTSNQCFQDDFRCFDINEFDEYYVTWNGGPLLSEGKTFRKPPQMNSPLYEGQI
jgi:hypothetical protein